MKQIEDDGMKRDDVAKCFNVVSAWDDKEMGLVKVLLKGTVFISGDYLVLLTDQFEFCLIKCVFDYLASNLASLFIVLVPDGDFGYLDTNGAFAIQTIYDWIQEFREGGAWGVRDGQRLIFVKSVSEIEPEMLPIGDYMEVYPFCNGGALFSIVDLINETVFMFSARAFNHDSDNNAAIWEGLLTQGDMPSFNLNIFSLKISVAVFPLFAKENGLRTRSGTTKTTPECFGRNRWIFFGGG